MSSALLFSQSGKRREALEDFDYREDRDLLDGYLSGDKSSMERLVRRHQQRVYAVAFRMMGNEADASDVLQDVFLKVIRKAGTFKGNAAFSTWLTRITVNRCYDLLRSRKPVEEFSEGMFESDANETHNKAQREEVREKVTDALKLLPDDQRAVVVLHDLQGYDYREIGEVLGLPEGTVKSRVSRGRMKIADLLSDLREQKIAE